MGRVRHRCGAGALTPTSFLFTFRHLKMPLYLWERGAPKFVFEDCGLVAERREWHGERCSVGADPAVDGVRGERRHTGRSRPPAASNIR